jgi:hypothetical protein
VGVVSTDVRTDVRTDVSTDDSLKRQREEPTEGVREGEGIDDICNRNAEGIYSIICGKLFFAFCLL